MSNLSMYWPFSPGESSIAHLGETISYDTVFYQVSADSVAERYASAAAGSGSAADAGGSQLQAVVRSFIRNAIFRKRLPLAIVFLVHRREFGDGEIRVCDRSDLPRNDIHMRTILGNSFLEDGPDCGDPCMHVASRRSQELAQ